MLAAAAAAAESLGWFSASATSAAGSREGPGIMPQLCQVPEYFLVFATAVGLRAGLE